MGGRHSTGQAANQQRYLCLGRSSNSGRTLGKVSTDFNRVEWAPSMGVTHDCDRFGSETEMDTAGFGDVIRMPKTVLLYFWGKLEDGVLACYY